MAREAIEDRPAFFSSVSLFELSILTNLGRLGTTTMSDFLRPEVWATFTLLPLREEHFFSYEALNFPSDHRDPFDRMLIAQAKAEAIPIVSSDKALDAYGVMRWWSEAPRGL